MLCESCKINESQDWAESSAVEYHLCWLCQYRLINYALRPLEYFNLCAIYGHSYYLHDDFYDNETGEATQPKVVVTDPDGFSFPILSAIRHDLQMLVDYACVQYFTSDAVIEMLKKHDSHAVLKYLDEKVKYNKLINYKAYEIAGKALGPIAYNWLKNEWENKEEEGSLLIFAEPISQSFPVNEAFNVLSGAAELSTDKEFAGNSLVLVYLQNQMTLDWIEANRHRIHDVKESWGTIAAASKFTWQRAERWLTAGRPLSLIAIDALMYCTTEGERPNQSFWLQKNKPRLPDNVKPDVIAKTLTEYLTKDNVPRTKNSIGKIINNLFDTTL
jgi:hypothetical protein